MNDRPILQRLPRRIDCRAIGWPPVKTYGCHVREIAQAGDETREAMRQLMWAAYDRMTK